MKEGVEKHPIGQERRQAEDFRGLTYFHQSQGYGRGVLKAREKLTFNKTLVTCAGEADTVTHHFRL